MNTELWNLIGGVTILRETLRACMKEHSIPEDVLEAIIHASRNANTRKGAETCTHAYYCSLQAYGVWGLKSLVRNMNLYTRTRWNGIKAAKSKKILRRWANER